MAVTFPTQFKFKLPYLQHLFPVIPSQCVTVKTTRSIRAVENYHGRGFRPKSCSVRRVLTRVSSDGGGGIEATNQQSTASDVDEISSSSLGDGYVSLFVRMLGLDNDPLDREQAIVALWKYSLGGKKYIDAIMQFPGCINLTINLLKSESSSTCEAASGLLRSISSINLYRDSVAESGAIEEITGLLSRPFLASEVLEQSLCVLWNLSVEEKYRSKIANNEVLPLLIKALDDEDLKIKEAAGGVLANLALSRSNHNIMVEAGVIPQLSKLLKTDVEGAKVIRKEARNALLELAKDDYYKILIMEEGLVVVPMIGADAYKSFTPGLHSWPRLPDGTEIEQTSKGPSRFGASELLLGLNIDDKNANIEEAKMNAIIGRTHQQFLARIGAIELQDGKKSPSQSQVSTYNQLTLLPWMDGVARLVLILGLEDESAVSRAAESIADASFSEELRILFKEAGAIKHLVRLLESNSNAVKLAALHALEKLSVSNDVCEVVEAEGVVYPLINTLKHSQISESALEKTLIILSRILDPGKAMKSKFYDGPVNGAKKVFDAARGTAASAGLSENMTDIPKSEARKEVLDSAVISRLVEILKTCSPDLQRKAASILEFATFIDPVMESLLSVDIESGLEAVFKQKIIDTDYDDEGEQPELYTLKIEEAGHAISAASRLLTKLLDSEQFRRTINSTHFTQLLRKTLKSNIPFHNKDWVAACLVKLSSLPGPNLDFDNSINIEVTLYETIPRLIEQIKTSLNPKAQEVAVVELNRIISEGVVDSTRAVASKGGIFPLVKLIEEGSSRAVEAGLAILYNLSMDSANHSAIVAAGAVPALRRIVLSQRPQWTRALHLLRTLPT